MTSPVIQTDVVVIGAGPIGLFSVFQCGMNALKCHVVEAYDNIGGQCSALYPEKFIYDIPGYVRISGDDLIQRLGEQAKTFQPVYHFNERAICLESIPQNKAYDDFRWQLTTDKGTRFYAKAVIIAAGMGAFGPNRPPINGIEEYEGKSIHYHVKSKANFLDKKVVIAGGGDSAVDWALTLYDIAEKVSVVHRRFQFRCSPESEKKLLTLAHEGKIELVIPYQLSSIEGEDGQLRFVVVKSLQGEVKELPADHLIAFFGIKMDLGPLLQWGLNVNSHGVEVDHLSLHTNLEGVFAVGDIASYPGKLKLILTGFAEAAKAAHCIRKLILKDESGHLEHSTTRLNHLIPNTL